MKNRRRSRTSRGGLGVLGLVRAIIARVPRGKVITYGEAAEAAGFPHAARLTVWALQGRNGIPWHRVVGAGGRIALPGEPGREQRLRLEVEGVTFLRGRVRMEVHGWVPGARRGRPNGGPEETPRTPKGRPWNGTDGPFPDHRVPRADPSHPDRVRRSGSRRPPGGAHGEPV
jgi:methylated-DNA-protein-cysteine methyltransferase related protein